MDRDDCAGTRRARARGVSRTRRAPPARSVPEQSVRVGLLTFRRPPLGLPGHAFGLELSGRTRVGAEEQRRDPIDGDPVPLFGHREVEAPQPRLDVRDQGTSNPPPARPRASSSYRRRRAPRRARSAATAATDPRRHQPPGRSFARSPVAGTAAPRARAPRRRPRTARGRSAAAPVRAARPLLDPGLAEAPSRERRRLGCRTAGAVAFCSTTVRTRIGARLREPLRGPLAQLVEQGTLNPKVEGSNPSRPIRTRTAMRKPHGYAGRACRSGRRCAWRAPTGAPTAGGPPPVTKSANFATRFGPHAESWDAGQRTFRPIVDGQAAMRAVCLRWARRRASAPGRDRRGSG